MSDAQLKLVAGKDLELVINRRDCVSAPLYSATMYYQAVRRERMLSFTSFEPNEVRIRKSTGPTSLGNFDLWLGNTCFSLTTDQVSQFCDFLGVQMPTFAGSAP